MFVDDPKTNKRFLIDTSSRMSVIPYWRSIDHPSVIRYLAAANKSKVSFYKTVELELSLKLNRTFKWRFQKARVHFAILRIDFWRIFV